MRRSNINTLSLSIIVLLSWFAIVLQFDLTLINRQLPLLQSIAKFFSYFTILTNILVATALSFILFSPGSSYGRFFSSAKVLTATTVYIIVVGAVYNVVLRPLATPQGLNWLANELLHLVVPLMTVLYWICFVDKKTLKWSDMWPWLLYPLAYFCITLFAGAYGATYPYPFIDVTQLGYSRVLINCLGVAALFIGLSLLMIALGKIPRSKKNN
ncbi:Pr6Pr family membrane protein [Pedobacter nutrimenti]|uniref:Pr6Pr family membrane protein n=1 Tax=Pedobacter nutrimenti TaxID=1241337 RepID=UPI00293099CF|nr:Pr6Pr family membrane protein [Pedobacter nutrimenti]